MLRIVHLSDLHLRATPACPENQNAKTIVRHLTREYQGDEATRTYIVLTGDLVEDGERAQFAELRKKVIQPLNTHFYEDHVLAAPGNHDYAITGMTFNKAAPALYRKFVHNCAGLEFPVVPPTNSGSVVFIGLDSADPKDKVWAARGVIGKSQLSKLRRRLNNLGNDKFVVLYLHHHPYYPFFGRELMDKAQLLNVIKRKVHLVLFGHKHRSAKFFDRYYVPLMFASGKVTQNEGDALVFRVIEIDNREVAAVHTEEIRAAARMEL